METGLIARMVITVGSLLLAAWTLIPTFLPPEMQAEVVRVADLRAMKDPPADAPEPEPWTHWVPLKLLVKGLDLQGGLNLMLEVDVDEAVRSVVQRDIQPLKKSAADQGVSLVEVRRDRKVYALLINAGPGVTLEQLKEIVRGRLDGYEYDSTRDDAGKSWMVFTLTEARVKEVQAAAVKQARDVIENRINATGVKEPQITLKGVTGIDVQLPGESDIERAVAALGTTAQLEFMLVDEDADMQAVSGKIEEARGQLAGKDFLDDELLSDWMLDNGAISPSRRLMWEYDVENKPHVRKIPYVIKDEVLLTGDDVNNARTEQNPQTGDYYVALDFKPHGSAIFGDVTGNNVGKRLAIVLDDRVKAAPNIVQRIDGTASISTGQPTIEKQFGEASLLALVLRTGALPAPVSVGEVRQVGSQLGERAIKEGTLAAAIGSGLVLLFAAIYYRVSGMLADISLAINVVLVMAALVAVGATLTLPGICGIALTIGMAVDCNIIIFERIREEIRDGRTLSRAIEVGFDRAFWAVFDGNITTLLAGVVLYSYGSGPLRGFAVTLMIGIFTTLYTGVFVSRTLMELAAARLGPRLSL
ncbi:MAG: protein translocase subunit SecD [Deltaproteobacteria bacterium]|nr:protein translocase subunit SecD [Deltaproteobacteria bacterium]